MKRSKYGACETPVREGEYETLSGQDWKSFADKATAKMRRMHEEGLIFQDLEADKKHTATPRPLQKSERKKCKHHACTNAATTIRGFCNTDECRKRRARESYILSKARRIVKARETA